MSLLQRGLANSSVGKKLIKLGFVGAGGINFGTPGEWNFKAWPFESLFHTAPTGNVITAKKIS